MGANFTATTSDSNKNHICMDYLVFQGMSPKRMILYKDNPILLSNNKLTIFKDNTWTQITTGSETRIKKYLIA
jgi:hypothetical protein